MWLLKDFYAFQLPKVPMSVATTYLECFGYDEAANPINVGGNRRRNATTMVGKHLNNGVGIEGRESEGMSE